MKRKAITTGERIRTIRGKMHQVKFGELLGVSQGAVSAWERDDKDRTPSADTYFRLAILASEPKDQLFFLQKAGLTPQTIVSAANKFLGEQVRHPEKGECVSIPRVEKTSDGLKDLGTSISMPVELVPNSASTYCFGISLMPGYFDEWAIVDTSDEGAECLGSFWGLPVLVEFTPSDRLSPHWRMGLAIGMLFLEEGQYTPDGIPWYVKFLEPHIGGMLFGASARIGRWMESRESHIAMILQSEWKDQPRLPGKDDASRTRRVSESIRSSRAAREIRLVPGCKVIGRVITWWNATQEPGRQTLKGLADQVRPSDLHEGKGKR